MMTETSFRMADGHALPLHRWEPYESSTDQPPAVMIAVHGFNDYGRFFDHFGTFLAGQGVTSYAFDQRGFGANSNAGVWAGVDAYPDDLREVVASVRDRHGDLPLFVFGESMGGGVTMLANARGPGLGVDGVILAAPAIWGRETMPFYQRWALDISAYVAPGLQLTGEGLNIQPSDNIEMLRAMNRDPLVIKKTRIDSLYGVVNLMDEALAVSHRLGPDAFVLYGAKDDVIQAEPTREMLRRFPRDAAQRPRVALYEDGYHMLIRDLVAPTIWQDVLAWMRDRAAPLPSGADIAGAAFFEDAIAD